MWQFRKRAIRPPHSVRWDAEVRKWARRQAVLTLVDLAIVGATAYLLWAYVFCS